MKKLHSIWYKLIIHWARATCLSIITIDHYHIATKFFHWSSQTFRAKTTLWNFILNTTILRPRLVLLLSKFVWYPIFIMWVEFFGSFWTSLATVISLMYFWSSVPFKLFRRFCFFVVVFQRFLMEFLVPSANLLAI